jgi:hypothetical protein
MAARVLEWPIRAISSLSVAPLWALDPPIDVFAELDLSSVGIKPLAPQHLGFGFNQPLFSGPLRVERRWGSAG